MSYALGQGTGPLRGVRVVEIAGIGPGPHACMMLADLGADVIRVERPGGGLLSAGRHDVMNRGRPSVALDLKHPDARRGPCSTWSAGPTCWSRACGPARRSGSGLGPDECLARNPALVYGRMTGWGQDGPWAQAAGHDLNYIAITGALHAAGQDPARPHFPTNLLGDFGGGSTYLVIGVLAALLEARASGTGQVVDAAIVDGAASLNAMGTMFASLGAAARDPCQRPARRRHALLRPLRDRRRPAHVGRPAGAAVLRRAAAGCSGIDDVAPDRDDPSRHAELRQLLADTFRQRTQAEWAEVFDGTDACVAPVLPLSEAVTHEHLAARGTYVEHEGVTQPAPAPRFSRTPGAVRSAPAAPRRPHPRGAGGLGRRGRRRR